MPHSKPNWDPDRFGVIYQIYPRSFQDSDGDGIGDLPGIERRLDHLARLGVGTIWLSPIYRSPMADFGYDVADHRDIDPMFGTIDDFDRVLASAHALGMRLVLDFVPNHTSDRHPWFVESRSSRESSKRDWYVWADPAPDGGPPNNWRSHFGEGSSWTFDPATGQWYLHLFAPQQPDLNWRNPEVVAAMHDVMRFWLDRGVDGFRVDVADHLVKDPDLRDQPPGPDVPGLFKPSERAKDQPGIHELMRGLRSVVDEYDDRVLIGELWLPPERLASYYGDGDELHLPFNFSLLDAGWDAAELRRVVAEYESAVPAHGWPSWVLGNHDRPRVATRFGPEVAPAAMMMLLTLRGTPTIYYGDELGLTDVAVPTERMHDPQGMDDPALSRDPCRSPMPWSEGPNAGFTEGEPWLPIGPENRERNVARQRSDPGSMLELTRRLIGLRSERPDLLSGDLRRIVAASRSPWRSTRPARRSGGIAADRSGSCCPRVSTAATRRLGESSSVPARAT